MNLCRRSRHSGTYSRTTAFIVPPARSLVTVTFVRCIFHHIFTDGPDFYSHHLISSFSIVEQECWSSMVRSARELCSGAADISSIIWTSHYTYANLSTLASSCEVHRRPWSIGDLDRRRSRLSTAPSCEVDDDLATHTRQYTLTLKCMLRGSEEFAVVRENTSWSEFQMLSSAALAIVVL